MNAYRQVQVTTAPQQELVNMMYKGVIRFAAQAKAAIQRGSIEEANRLSIKVQDILAELMSSLNYDVPLANHLHQLYEYMHRKVVQANVQKNIGPLEEVTNLMRQLSETWEEAFGLGAHAKRSSGQPEGGISIAR